MLYNLTLYTDIKLMNRTT